MMSISLEFLPPPYDFKSKMSSGFPRVADNRIYKKNWEDAKLKTSKNVCMNNGLNNNYLNTKKHVLEKNSIYKYNDVIPAKMLAINSSLAETIDEKREVVLEQKNNSKVNIYVITNDQIIWTFLQFFCEEPVAIL